MFSPGNMTAWTPCKEGEVVNFTTNDLVLPWNPEESPECLQHDDHMKKQSMVEEKVAADETQAKTDNLASHEKIFFNAVENSVVAVNTETKRLKSLQT